MVTWNCKGIWHSDDTKRRNKIDKIASLCHKHIFVCLQESHTDGSELEEIKKCFWFTEVFHSGVSRSSAGVIILFNKELGRRASIELIPDGDKVLDIGHIICIQFKCKHLEGRLSNAYIDSHSHIQKRIHFDLLNRELRREHGRFNILAGDFNFVEIMGDKISIKRTPENLEIVKKQVNGTTVQQFRNKILIPFKLKEVPQSAFTFLHVNKSYLARLDRFYITDYAADGLVCDRSCKVLPVDRALSDHDPVILNIRNKDPPPFHRLSEWTLRHEDYMDITSEKYFGHCLSHSENPWLRFAALDCAIKRASLTIKHEVKIVSDPAHKIAICALFYKRIQDPEVRPEQITELTYKVPRLNSFIKRSYCRVEGACMSVDIDGFRQYLDVIIRVVGSRNDEGNDQNDPKQNSFIKNLAALKPKIDGQLSWVIDPETEEITDDPEEINRITKAHWGNVWAERHIPSSFFTQYLSTPPFQIVDGDWSITKEDVLKIITSSKNSAPGCDGIPFLAYKVNSDLASNLFFDVVTNMLSDDPAQQPKDLNDCLLYLLPKKPKGVLNDVPYYSSDRTRPISVGKSMERILSNILRSMVARNVEHLISEEQRGFLANRLIHHNIHEMIRAFSATLPRDQKRVLLLVDFEAAFPSVNQKFIWRTLQAVGVPHNVIRAIKMLFTDVSHNLVFNKKLMPHASVFSGIKQGDPISPLLFVICMDALLARLKRKLNDGSFARAYADDAAIYIHDFERDIGAIANEFAIFGRASGCRVNLQKSFFLSTKEWLPDDRHPLLGTPWEGMTEIDACFPESGIYLGILIGRNVKPVDMLEPAVNKFERRVQAWGQVPLSISARISVANIFLISIFSYLIQFILIPGHTINRINSIIMRFVYRFFYLPFKAATWIDLILGIKPSVRDIWYCNLSALVKQDCLNNPNKTRMAHRICPDNHRSKAIKWIRSNTGHTLESIIETHDPRGVKEHTQAWWYASLRKSSVSRGTLVQNWWTERCSKWTNISCGPIDASVTMRNLQKLQSKLCSNDHHNLFKCIINAIPTKKRTRHWKQHDSLLCTFCNREEDSVHHFFDNSVVSCCIIQSAFESIFNTAFDPRKVLLQFPAGDIKHYNPRWATFVTALVRARDERSRLNVDWNNAYTLLRNRDAIIRWFEYYAMYPKKKKKKVKAKNQLHLRPIIIYIFNQYHRVVVENDEPYVIAPNGIRSKSSWDILKKAYAKRNQWPIHIFTDGSFDNKIVEGVTVPCAAWGSTILGVANRPCDLNGDISTDPQSSIFRGARKLSNEAGEACAIIGALEFLVEIRVPINRQVIVFCDSQNTIDALSKTYSHTNPQLFANLRSSFYMIKTFAVIRIRKVAGHQNMFWNERADQLAKKGYDGPTQDLTGFPFYQFYPFKNFKKWATKYREFFL